MRYLLIISLMLFSLSPLFGQKDKKYVREGNREYNRAEYEKSELEYRRALDVNPKSEKATFNLGDVFYRMGKYEEATGEFDKHSSLTDNRNAEAAAHYNRGNSFLKAGKIEESIESYKSSLRADPSNHMAKYNLAYAQDLLKQQQQQKEQQQQNKDDQSDNKKDNQDNQQDQNDNKSDQDNNQQQQQQQDKDKQQQQAGAEQKMTKADAERLLQALANEEKEVQEKVKEEKAAAMRVKTLKNW